MCPYVNIRTDNNNMPIFRFNVTCEILCTFAALIEKLIHKTESANTTKLQLNHEPIMFYYDYEH